MQPTLPLPYMRLTGTPPFPLSRSAANSTKLSAATTGYPMFDFARSTSQGLLLSADRAPVLAPRSISVASAGSAIVSSEAGTLSGHPVVTIDDFAAAASKDREAATAARLAHTADWVTVSELSNDSNNADLQDLFPDVTNRGNDESCILDGFFESGVSLTNSESTEAVGGNLRENSAPGQIEGMEVINA